jgi:putative lipoic acid-binding regulatory protein
MAEMPHISTVIKYLPLLSSPSVSLSSSSNKNYTAATVIIRAFNSHIPMSLSGTYIHI